mgnify:CR=1 FL=1
MKTTVYSTHKFEAPYLMKANDGKHHLKQYLPSVCCCNYPNLEIVVGDNGSTDGSVSLLKTEFPDVKIIRNPINFGFAKGYNEVLKSVKSDFYVILNSDVKVPENWLETAITFLNNNPNNEFHYLSQ